MGQISLQAITPGQPDSSEEPKIPANFTTLQTLVNGNLDSSNLGASAGVTAAQLASAVTQAAGLNDASVRRGKSIIDTSEARTSTSYGLLTTPDRVQSVVLPSNGLIFVLFQAIVTQSVSTAGRVAIFLGSNQLINQFSPSSGSSAGTVQEANWAGVNPAPLHTLPRGLFAADSGINSLLSPPATTGVAAGASNGTVAGGPCAIFAAAGTYTISVQVKASSGSVTMSDRKLWVWTMGF